MLLSASVTVIEGSSARALPFSVKDRLVPLAVTKGRAFPSTVMVNDWMALVSVPPFAVPPLSWILTVAVAEPAPPASV